MHTPFEKHQQSKQMGLDVNPGQDRQRLLACRPAAVSRHLMADTLNLPSFKSRHRVHGDANVAILSRRKTHLHKTPSPTADSFVDLPAKADVSEVRSVVHDH